MLRPLRALSAVLLLAVPARAFDGSSPVLSPELLPPALEAPEAAFSLPGPVGADPLRWSSAAQAARLAATAGDGEEFTLGVLGDMEPGRFPWQRIFAPKDGGRRLLRDLLSAQPALVFQLGDFVSKGTDAAMHEGLDFLDAEAAAPFFVVIGNHDRSRPNGPADKRAYTAAFGSPDFYVDHRGWRLIALDSSDRSVTPDQLAWLRGALDTPLRKMVFTHVPPAYLKGAIRAECPKTASLAEVQPDAAAEAKAGAWSQTFMGYFSEGAEGFEALVRASGVERVFFGHLHAFGTAEHNGVRYVLSGGGGSPLYPMPPWEPQCRLSHSLELRLGPEGILSETVRPLEGPSFPLWPSR
jgi:predicted phosphodiesterase